MDEFAAAAGVAVRTLYRLFGSRQALLREAGCAAEPSARQRILDAALDQVGRQGLAELSMDELAAAAGVSRATLYRLFPGKSALFGELIRTFSPWEPVADVIDAMPDGDPEDVMPAVGRPLPRPWKAASECCWAWCSNCFKATRTPPRACERAWRADCPTWSYI